MPRRRCTVNGVSCEYAAERCPEVGDEVHVARERATGKVACAAESTWNNCRVRLRVRRYAQLLEHTTRVHMDGECTDRFQKGGAVAVHYSQRRGAMRLADGSEPWDDATQMALCLFYGACAVAALGGAVALRVAHGARTDR